MLLLSIRPKYVDAILAGEKRVELRRRRPRVESGRVLVYATAPRMELVATFRITGVTRAPLNLLWQSVRDIAGVSRREFDAYFEGMELGYGLHIKDVVRLNRPIPLVDLRSIWAGFHPPQGFRYITQLDFEKLGIRELCAAA